VAKCRTRITIAKQRERSAPEHLRRAQVEQFGVGSVEKGVNIPPPHLKGERIALSPMIRTVRV
jgi:hypothetical protein